MKLNSEQIGLIVNALREKATGDRKGAEQLGAHRGVGGIAGIARTIETLNLQAALGDELADVFENAVDAEVRS